MGDSRVLVLSSAVFFGCAHPASTTCPKPAPAPAATLATPRGLAWADARAFDAPGPDLGVYEVKWLLASGDSGALVEVPAQVHSFTLGRWECAVSAEKAADALADGVASIDRARRLVCTHATGLTMQTDVRCQFRIPSPPADGAPSNAHRDASIALGEAPVVKLMCEPTRADRVTLRDGNGARIEDVCLVGGSVAACPKAP